MRSRILMLIFLWSNLICGCLMESKPLESNGTLIVMIPTKDGIIIASDTRSQIAGITFDGKPKISIINAETALAITGTFEILPKPPSGIDLKEWIPKAPRLISFLELAESHLKNDPNSISTSSLNDLGEFLKENVADYLKKQPPENVPQTGRDFCQIVIAQYDAISHKSRFGQMHVGVSRSGNPRTTNVRVMTFDPNEKPPFLRFGESTYLNEQVLSRKGKSLLPAKFHELGSQAKTIEDLPYTSGAFMAHALIEAASERAKEVPPPTAIGGPTYVTLIDGIHNPIKLNPENGFTVQPKTELETQQKAEARCR